MIDLQYHNFLGGSFRCRKQIDIRPFLNFAGVRNVFCKMKKNEKKLSFFDFFAENRFLTLRMCGMRKEISFRRCDSAKIFSIHSARAEWILLVLSYIAF